MYLKNLRSSCLFFFQGLQPLEQSDMMDMGSAEVETPAIDPSKSKSLNLKGKLSMEAALLGKPQR